MVAEDSNKMRLFFRFFFKTLTHYTPDPTNLLWSWRCDVRVQYVWLLLKIRPYKLQRYKALFEDRVRKTERAARHPLLPEKEEEQYSKEDGDHSND